MLNWDGRDEVMHNHFFLLSFTPKDLFKNSPFLSFLLPLQYII